MTYPAEHQSIVNALFREGRFLVAGDPCFLTLREHVDLYRNFFSESFGLELLLMPDYALVRSAQDDDRFARAICIYLAVVCSELDREGKDLLETLHYGTFDVEEWELRLEQSSYAPILEATDHLRDREQRRKFYLKLARRGLLLWVGDTAYRWTAGVGYFLDFARGVGLGEAVD